MCGAGRHALSLAYSVLLLGLVLLLSACAPSIQINPAQVQTAAGTALQLTATQINVFGKSQDVTSEVTWSSSNSAVAAVSGAGGTPGQASALTPGSATISAKLSGSTGNMTLTVTSAVLTSIEVTPAAPSLPNGLTEQFIATGVYSDNSTQDLTTQVTWVSSGPAVATISNTAGTSGLASAASVGTTTISATSGAISGSTTLTVSSATLVSIQVTPATPSIPKGVSRQFSATGIFSDNSTQNLSTQVTWASSNTAVATISNATGSQGLASSVTVGSTMISATSGSISGSTGLTVTSATLVSIAVTPANPSIPNGLTKQFTATGTYTDNSTQNLTTQVTWVSSKTAVATISNAAGSQGLASSAEVGSTTISATSGSISGSTTLTVTAATLVSIAVTPANPSIANGLTEQFTATGTYSDNSTQNLTTQVTWASSNTAVATISNAAGSQGLASSAAVGSTTISATSGAISGSTGLTVTSATLVSIAVTPANPSIANGLTEQFAATGTYTDNSTQNLTTQVTWASSNTAVATISNAASSQGLASSAAEGSTTISATSGAISGSTGLTVTSATLVSIAVTPANPSIVNGLTEQFTATGTYTDNSTQNLTTQVTWASSDTGVATISNASGSQGLASSAALGSTTISATSGAIPGSTGLTVTTCAVGFTTCEVVTIDHTQVGTSDSSNFPMLFSGTYSFLATAANGGFVQNTVTQQGLTVPADAVFTSDSTCTVPLNWEVQSYDATTGAVNIWVQIPTLSHTADTLVYICVGNSSLTAFQGGAIGAAWDSNYQGVWHLSNGTTLSTNDSTANANNGTNNGATAASGQIDGAAAFNGSSYIDVGNNSSIEIAGPITLEAWANIFVPPGWSRIVSNLTGSYYEGFELLVAADYDGGEFYLQTGDGSNTTTSIAGWSGTPSYNTWYHVVGTYDGTTGTLYVNGSQNGSTFTVSNAIGASSEDVWIGAWPGDPGGGNWDGSIAEVRISNVARSSSWIQAEYNNQFSPSTFYTVGSQN